MSIKSLVQFIIILLIILIIGSVYLNYFQTKQSVVQEIELSEKINSDKLIELEKKISDLELENSKLKSNAEVSNKSKPDISQKLIKIEEPENKIDEIQEKSKSLKKAPEEKKKEKIKIKDEVKNLVKDVAYTSVDQKGNRFHLLANSGKSNSENNDILDLINVRGKIESDMRDTIYIVSDFAQYNSVNLNSKFYQNVIIDYQDKRITCINFDINMETNKAIAYNDVVITDPKSVMKAGIVEFDLKTKNININPESVTKEIEVVTE